MKDICESVRSPKATLERGPWQSRRLDELRSPSFVQKVHVLVDRLYSRSWFVNTAERLKTLSICWILSCLLQ